MNDPFHIPSVLMDEALAREEAEDSEPWEKRRVRALAECMQMVEETEPARESVRRAMKNPAKRALQAMRQLAERARDAIAEKIS